MDDLADEVKAGNMDFDVVIASPFENVGPNSTAGITYVIFGRAPDAAVNWVGADGVLADAAFASADRASSLIVAAAGERTES